VSKVYWGPENQYNPNAQSYLPPLCYSDNGIGPSRGSGEPQAPTCLQCPNNVWGSATSRITGKGIKACSDIMKVAFTTAGHNTVFMLRVPPNSLKNLGVYQGSFSGQAIDISDVITRISFVPGIQGTLQFQAVNYIDEPTAQLREQALASKATDALIGRNDVVHPGAGMIANGQPVGQIAPPAGHVLQFAVQPQPIQQHVMQTAVQPAQQTPFVVPARPQSAQPAPFVPGSAPLAGAQSTPMAPQPAQQAVPNAAPRTRGRPRGQAQQPAPTPQAAPFPTAQPAPAAPGNNFGIQAGVAPNPELQAVLGSVFPQQ
jgi:hypothetical protein